MGKPGLSMTPKRIGLIGFDGVTALHLIGPGEAFRAASLDDGYGGRIPCYEVCTIGATSKKFTAESGVQLEAQASLKDAPDCDTVIIAGGIGILNRPIGEHIAESILRTGSETRRIASVCTGIYGVAPTGLLDGRDVTVHWRYARDVAQRFPQVRVDHKRALVQDGAFYTSSGLSAGINLSLALIREDYGPHVAQSVERELVLYPTLSDGRDPAVERTAVDSRPNERFADLVPWIVRNLHSDLSVEVLARRACMCPNHFSKAFKSVFGEPPRVFVENLRLNEARRRLSKRQKTVYSVAASVGFDSSDSFQRAFQRRFGRRATSYLREADAKHATAKVVGGK
jgi:transcriptional regulator GlxA family with amidase domain